jgi:serine/threonine-protein kinase
VGQIIGEYRVEGKLGEGAFGAVYRAVHPLIGKAAAIKVLHRQYSSNPQMVSRFVAEARAVNQIRHRNIIDIFSFGALADGRQYYVMELLEGKTLDRYLDEEGPLTPEVALPLLRQIARALDAAHAAGIVHRDLKPENIFLAFDEEQGIFPKLLDFGIAKLMAPPDSGTDLTQGGGAQHQGAKTRTGTPMGTPYYMSPEQCRGRNVDHRTDIYSFGVLTHRMLTGVLPFDGEDVVDLLLKHATQPPPRMSAVLSSVPPQLDTPVLQMMEKDPSNRPVSLLAAIEALTQAAQRVGLTIPGAASLRNGPQGPNSGPQPISTPVPAGPTSGKLDPTTALAATLVPDTSAPSAPAPVDGRRRVVAAALAVAALGLFTIGGVAVARRGSGGEALPAADRSSSLAASITATTAAAASATTAPAASAALTASAAQVATVVPVPVASAQASSEVELTITDAPPGAQVFLGAAKLGEAPGPLRIRRGEGALSLTVKAPGYRPKTLSFIPVASGTMEAKLSKVAKAGPVVNGELEKPY